METDYLENNSLKLVGKVTGKKNFSHEIFGEKFYNFNLEVPRLSAQTDNIPITVSERLLNDNTLKEGNTLYVSGQFRSYNSAVNSKNKLVLTAFAKDLEVVPDETTQDEMAKKDKTTNEIVLKGYICKKPIYRQTPFGREIADLLLAVNRAYNKSDYIPCIAWGRNARYCKDLEIGQRVKVVGRIQSREYEKKFEDGTVEKRCAYEISIGSLELLDEQEQSQNMQNV